MQLLLKILVTSQEVEKMGEGIEETWTQPDKLEALNKYLLSKWVRITAKKGRGWGGGGWSQASKQVHKNNHV